MLSSIRFVALASLLSSCVINTPVGTAPVSTAPVSTAPLALPNPNAAPATAPSVSTGQPTNNAEITDAKLAEISGITASSIPTVRFWAINDSGNDSILFAIGNSGELLGQYLLPEKNRDWESLSRTQVGNQSILIVGETGDNRRHHKQYQLHFVAEPPLSAETKTPVTDYQTLRYRFPTGNHNVEAMAATGNAIYLITKEPLRQGKPTAGKLFRLDIDNVKSDVEQVATYMGQMRLRPGSLTSSIAASIANVDLNQATALTFATDESAAYVLTYRHVIRFAKHTNQSWSDALLGQGRVIHAHGLRQAEAMTIDDDGVLWLTSEKLPAPIRMLPTYTQFE